MLGHRPYVPTTWPTDVPMLFGDDHALHAAAIGFMGECAAAANTLMRENDERPVYESILQLPEAITPKMFVLLPLHDRVVIDTVSLGCKETCNCCTSTELR